VLREKLNDDVVVQSDVGSRVSQHKSTDRLGPVLFQRGTARQRNKHKCDEWRDDYFAKLDPFLLFVLHER
jgi:hypothetical protein